MGNITMQVENSKSSDFQRTNSRSSIKSDKDIRASYFKSITSRKNIVNTVPYNSGFPRKSIRESIILDESNNSGIMDSSYMEDQINFSETRNRAKTRNLDQSFQRYHL